MRRLGPAIVASVRNAADIESGFALYASLTTVTPSALVVTSIRCRDRRSARDRLAATCSGVAPSSSPTAAADRALPTWWAPCRPSVTVASPCGVTSRKVALACSSSWTSTARTSASSAVPTRTTLALVRSAMARTSGSSALRIATSVAASASSPLASAMPSREPNSARCAVPTFSTTPMRGGAISQSARMCPAPRADSSRTRCRVLLVGTQHGPRVPELVVEGAGRRDGRTERFEHLADEVLGGGLAGGPGDPDDGEAGQPVDHGPRGGGKPGEDGGAGRRPCPRRARRHARATGSTGGTMTAGASTSRAASTATAPFSMAAAAKSCPSTRSPGTATNRPPGPIFRESNSTDPVTVSWPVALCTRPPVASAISASVRGITDAPCLDAPKASFGAVSAPKASFGADKPAGSWGLLLQAGLIAARSSSWSENGCTTPLISCPVSWPLPAMTTTSPGWARFTASVIAVRRSPMSRISPRSLGGTASAPARIAARIAAGSSVRGLSSVTISNSLRRAAASPIIGRFSTSRSPPQPSTMITRPSVRARIASRASATAAGLWA